MLRKTFLNKYKKKDENDIIKSFYKTEEDNSIAKCIPINAKDIRKLKGKSFDNFVEDICVNKKVNKVLFSSNAKIEIKYYLKSKEFIKNINRKQNQPKPVVNNTIEAILKRKAHSLAGKRRAYDEYRKAKKIIDHMEKESRENNENMNDKVIESYFQYKKDLDIIDRQSSQKSFQDKVKSFRRTFRNIKEKTEHLQQQLSNNLSLTTSESLYNSKKLLLPDYKLKLHNVYSRLYHNAVLTESIKEEHKSLQTDLFDDKKKTRLKPLKIKNALRNNLGKEYVVKVDNDMTKQCFVKYSCGITGKKALNMMNSNNSRKCLTSRNFSEEKDFDLLNHCDKNKNTFLHTAAEEDVPTFAKHLIDKGANVNLQNKNGDTPLHIALRHKNYEIIGYLLDAGASVTISNKADEIPYDLADNKTKNMFDFSKYYAEVSKMKLEQATIKRFGSL